MKKVLLTIVAMFLPFLASAQTVEINGIYYELSEDGSLHAIVTGNNGSISGDVEISDAVEYDLKKYSVTSIGQGAFYGCTGLTSVTIPNSVETIGEWAFQDCTSLTSVTIPSSVISVGMGIFEQCSSLGDVKVVVMDYSKFCNNQILSALIYREEATNVSIRLIDTDGDEITDYIIPDGVTTIGNAAFKGCANLTSITIPNSVTSIGDYAFYNCSGLKLVISEISMPFDVNAFGWSDTSGFAFEWGMGSPRSWYLPTLVVPKGTRNAYKSVSGWDLYTFEEGETIYDKQQIDEQGIVYELREADDFSLYYAVTGHSDDLKSEIVIPANLGGCPVKTLEGPNEPESGAFSGCSNLTSVKLSNQLTNIDYYAFKGCTGLTSITIPNSVTTIGEGAFYDCTGLKLVTSEISTPFEVNAFGWSDSSEHSVSDWWVGLPPNWYLPTLIVPKGSRSAYKNTNVWKYFFTFEEGETIYDREQTDEQGICYQLREADDFSLYYAVTGHNDDLKSEIVIPADIDGCPVKTIECLMAVGAFDGCTDLTSVKILGNQMTTIGERAFHNCTNLTTVKMANSVRSIGDYAFSECTSLTSITLPKDLESIGYSAFSSEEWDNYCPITSIHIPHRVKTIGDAAFRYCPDLALVSFDVDVDGNSALTSIGNYAFSGCSFASITIPNSVISIGSGAFQTNYNLTTAILSDGITEIASWMFQNCGNLASITIPEGVTKIGEYAFQMCWSLRSIKLPESLTSMGENAFSGCQLKSIELPNSFTEIPANLFSENDLEYIKLGNNVKSIGKNAFGSWLDAAMDESLVVIEIGTSTPPTISKDAFPRLETLSAINVIVPDAAAEKAYRKAAVWKEMTFSNQDNISEVTVDTPGDLDFELITECDMQPAKVVNLKVKGTINAKDFDQMRTNMKSLLRLDLSECDITEIPEGALQDKTQLQELTLPTKLKTIGNYAFEGCPYLTGKLSLPSGVTSIGDYAFKGTNYTSVALPNRLQTIGSYAFYNVPFKQKIMLPDALTSIGDYAFAETHISGHAELPEGIKYLGAGAFRNTQIDPVSLPDNPDGIKSVSRELFQGCTSFDYIYIPRNFTEVSGYAFDGCTNLTYVRMSPNLETLGEYAFQNTQLEYLKVPSKVEVLSEGVLKNCNNLESLSLPANLKSVGRDALRGCNALRNLSVDAIQPPTVEKSALIGINTDLCLISIPTTSYRQYVTAEYWGQFIQMRNDIAVETEGDGEIGFESVAEEEEEVSASRRNSQRSAAARAINRAPSATNEESMTFANNGSSVYVPKNGKVRFIIIPGEGEELLSATLDGKDIMPYIEDGVYTATADKKNAKLVVKFSGTDYILGDADGDTKVDVNDVTSTINHILNKPVATFIEKAADMDQDGKIDVNDVQAIIYKALGK